MFRKNNLSQRHVDQKDICMMKVVCDRINYFVTYQLSNYEADTILCEYDGYRLTYNDTKCVWTGDWLNDQVFNYTYHMVMLLSVRLYRL